MKVFFGVSPRAIPQNKATFQRIFDCIEAPGHYNLNRIPIDADLQSFYNTTEPQVQDLYQDLMIQFKKADAVVIEASMHSLTMGFYIKMALDLIKPTIILHQPGSAPFFFAGTKNSKLQILEYDSFTLKQVLTTALEYAFEEKQVRFNMLLDSELNRYLSWAARRLHMLRSSYIRKLLLADKNELIQAFTQDQKL